MFSSDYEAQTANLAIDVVIIGASVAGLACAYSLRQAGHKVHVLEALSSLGKSPGGVRIPPNMSRILIRWGLGPKLEELMSGRCTKVAFYSGASGETIGELLFHEEVMSALGAENYLLHHSDLVSMLYELAKGAGAQFSFDCRVTVVDSKSSSVTISSGENIRADLVVGADGDGSIVRLLLLGDVGEDESSPNTSYLFTIPRESFKDDEELLQLMKEPMWNVWMGSGWSIVAHVMRKSTELAVTLLTIDNDSDAQRGWNQVVPIRDLDTDRFKFAPVLDRLMKLAGDAICTKSATMTPLETWHDEEGHIIVVGEAARHLYPGSSFGAALAVEDAVVLGCLFSKLKSRDNIKRLLCSFQELRQPRCETVCASEQQKLEVITMPPGPQRDMRDQFFRMQMAQDQPDCIDSMEGSLRRSLEDFQVLFGYDAFEDADSWWIEWGTLFERMNNGNEISDGEILRAQIAVETEFTVE